MIRFTSVMDELLQLWDLQHCQEILQENCIGDFDTLEELIDNPDDFKELFPVLSLRLKLKKMCKSISTKEMIEISTKAAPVPNVTPVSKAVRVPEPPPILPTAQVLPVETVRIERIAREPRTQAVANCDLKKVLNEHPFGPSILDTYQKKNLLDNVCQSYLCDIIILHFLKCSKSRLENNDFEFLSYKIKELFPNECNQTYYVPPLSQNVSRSGKSVMSKGKLVDKYRNRCTFIRAAKSSTISNTQVQASVAETVTDNETALNSKEWLKDNREEVEVFKHWSTSYSLRVADTDNQQNKSFSSITSEWPILKELIGYKLIHSDFSTKFSTTYENFTCNWDRIFPKLLDSNKSKLTDKENNILQVLRGDDVTEDAKQLMQFKLLISIFSPKGNKITVAKSSTSSTDKKSKTKVYWKPTAVESIEGIILEVKIAGDIQNEIDNKRQKMSEMGLNMQPFIIVVAQDVTEVEKVYICIDNTTYEPDSVPAGLFGLMQIYLIYNLAYPVETENACYFIQWCLLNIRTPSDNQIPAVYTLINRLNKSKA